MSDIFLFKPVFAQDKLVAYLCTVAHYTDIGGRVAGGNASDSTEIYQEGIRIPPLKLYSQGVPNETIFRLLEKAVRVPGKVLADVRGQVAALHSGEQDVLGLVRRHGIEEVLSVQEELLNYTEELARGVLRTMPDGSWSLTDYIDDDGITDEAIAIVAGITKDGDEVRVDFGGTSPQCKGLSSRCWRTPRPWFAPPSGMCWGLSPICRIRRATSAPSLSALQREAS